MGQVGLHDAHGQEGGVGRNQLQAEGDPRGPGSGFSRLAHGGSVGLSCFGWDVHDLRL